MPEYNIPNNNSNTLATLEMITNSPSRKNFLTLETEDSLREYGCLLIQSSGILMKLPQVVMASAAVLFQRDAVMGCLLLATKTEESLRRVRDIILTVDITIKYHRGFPLRILDCSSHEYLDYKDSITVAEMKILRSLGFNVQVQLPYGLLINYLQCLEIATQEKLSQTAWNYLNDSLKTKLYICFQVNTIACAAIYTVCEEMRIKLPSNPAWYEIFDVDRSDLICASNIIKDMYSKKICTIFPVSQKETELYLSNKLNSHVLREKELLIKSQLLLKQLTIKSEFVSDTKNLNKDYIDNDSQKKNGDFMNTSEHKYDENKSDTRLNSQNSNSKNAQNLVNKETYSSRKSDFSQENEYKSNSLKDYSKSQSNHYHTIKDKSIGLQENASIEKNRGMNRSRERYRDNKESRNKSKERYRDIYRDRSRERYRDRSRERYRDRSREKYRDRSREKYRDKDENRNKDRYRA
ncbi:hypothetical protein BB561_002610 [Smittium simulii]|uniref:Cyclin N-terminal domain-containing protein n=1 Tax=Smittium simulii TaxID=133385 RepID=A0A2T9YPW7_9FUNG|nr:hypothetical protein BB561_002610 [Smittium simulii]